jgi:Lung seven transmembrane receptor
MAGASSPKYPIIPVVLQQQMLLHAAMVFFCADNADSFQKLHDSANNDVAPGNMTIRSIVAALHAGFVVWTLLAFHTTLRTLRGDTKGRGVRLQVYRILAGCLLTVGAACVAYLLFEAYIHATHPVYDKWQYEWVRSRCSDNDLLYCLTLLVRPFWNPATSLCCSMCCVDGQRLPVCPDLLSWSVCVTRR